MRLLAALITLAPLAGCAVMTTRPVTDATPGMQYLYGSGEGAAITTQAFRVLSDRVTAAVHSRPTDSVILSADATLDNPQFVPCGSKPLAVVFDVDETVLSNLGFESDEARHPGRGYSDARWQRWEREGVDKVAPRPGAGEAIEMLRAVDVAVIFISNRSSANAAFTAKALGAVGLGPTDVGTTLLLKSDEAGGDKKDKRRQIIATRYCVVAMAGDQLGDFSDLFNAGLSLAQRRRASQSPAIMRLWGAGWFVLPNPVYGTALKGSIDEIFPADKRWASPATEK